MERDFKSSIRRHIREGARGLRRELTPAEKRLWEVIRRDQCGGFRFLRQHPIGPYVVDFYCAERKLAIEVDGSIHSLPEVAQFDASRQEALEVEQGIQFLRLTNEEVPNASSSHRYQIILTALQTQVGPPPAEGPCTPDQR